MDLSKISQRLRALSVFRNLLSDEVIDALSTFLLERDEDAIISVDNYSFFVSRLYAVGGNLTEHVKNLVYNDENAYIKLAGGGNASAPVPAHLPDGRRNRGL